MAAGTRGHRGFSSKTRSLITVMMMLFAALLVFLIFVLIGVPSAVNTHGLQSGGATIALQFPHTTQAQTKVGDASKQPYVEVLSWEPRAFVYHHLLTDAECDHLIGLAKPNMQKSTVVDSATGRSKDSRVRTSSGTFLNRGQDAIITRIEKKIAEFTFVPVEHGEGLQVLHYEVGQKYEPHYDYFHDSFNTKNGGQRIATVLMYLSDVEAGGETVFPASKVNGSTVPNWNELSECAKAGLSVQPRKGMALLFWSMNPDTTLDSKSLHGGCPVIEGNKWSATKWLHVNKVKTNLPLCSVLSDHPCIQLWYCNPMVQFVCSSRLSKCIDAVVSPWCHQYRIQSYAEYVQVVISWQLGSFLGNELSKTHSYFGELSS